MKRALPHTSDLQTSIIHNFKCIKAMGLQNVQFRVLRSGDFFKVVSYLGSKLWSFKVKSCMDVCGRPLFANPVTNIATNNINITNININIIILISQILHLYAWA